MKSKKELYVGVMSGTSMDAIDTVLVAYSNNKLNTIANFSVALPQELKQELLALCFPGDNEIDRLGQIDVEFAELTAKAINSLLKNHRKKMSHLELRPDLILLLQIFIWGTVSS